MNPIIDSLNGKSEVDEAFEKFDQATERAVEAGAVVEAEPTQADGAHFALELDVKVAQEPELRPHNYVMLDVQPNEQPAVEPAASTEVKMKGVGDEVDFSYIPKAKPGQHPAPKQGKGVIQALAIREVEGRPTVFYLVDTCRELHVLIHMDSMQNADISSPEARLMLHHAPFLSVRHMAYRGLSALPRAYCEKTLWTKVFIRQ